MGPWVVPAADIPDPSKLRIRTYVNGEKRQDGTTDLMIWDIPALIEVVRCDGMSEQRVEDSHVGCGAWICLEVCPVMSSLTAHAPHPAFYSTPHHATMSMSMSMLGVEVRSAAARGCPGHGYARGGWVRHPPRTRAARCPSTERLGVHPRIRHSAVRKFAESAVIRC